MFTIQTVLISGIKYLFLKCKSKRSPKNLTKMYLLNGFDHIGVSENGY